MSFESVKAILDGHTYASLIGLREDAWLEAKGRIPYDLGAPEGRFSTKTYFRNILRDFNAVFFCFPDICC